MRPASATRGRHYENFPVASLLVPARHARARGRRLCVCACGRRLRRRRRPAVDERHRLLDGWLAAPAARRQLGRARAGRRGRASPRNRSRSSSRSAQPSARVGCRCALFEDLAERVPAGRDGDAIRQLGGPARLLPPLGQSGRPPRAADRGLSTTRGSTRWSDAICTALQLTNFWQDLSVDLARGRMLPAAERCARRPGETCGRTHHASVAAALAAAARRTRALFDAGRPLVRRGPRPTALRAARHVARRHRAFSIASSVELDGVPTSRPRSASLDAPWFAWRALTWPGREAAMSRDTSFYYSFLVLPPRKRSAIDRGVGLLPRGGRRGGRGSAGRGRSHAARGRWQSLACGAELDAPASAAPRRATRAGARAAAVHPRVRPAARSRSRS